MVGMVERVGRMGMVERRVREVKKEGAKRRVTR